MAPTNQEKDTVGHFKSRVIDLIVLRVSGSGYVEALTLLLIRSKLSKRRLEGNQYML